ncbi:hypothetical protein ACQW02_09510 [Humitalea sp. 24SJ18S-53]|uniref:hypothetical protein n=1 Tax=Humitalea sp. 24SJ18S-53 TaxID=3422307 RepID=UPI003D664865
MRNFFGAAAAFLGGATLWSGEASAHIKWFSSYDLNNIPNPPTIFANNPAWIWGMVVSTFIIVVCVGIDRFGISQSSIARRFSFTQISELNTDHLLRLSTGIWLVFVSQLPDPVFLTPETYSGNSATQNLQLILAAFCLSRHVCWVAGLGVAFLWFLACEKFGIFHILDYPIFLGISVYLISISISDWRNVNFQWIFHHRVFILTISLALTLAWGAIEKWSYPQWTYPLLEARPYLTFGFSSISFMALAGWVEWVAAFTLIFGGVWTRKMSAIALLAIMLAAVLDFGFVDLIGHFPIIICLLIATFHRSANMLDHAKLRRNLQITPAAIRKISICFGSMAMMSIAYFFFWDLGYGNYFCVDWINGITYSSIGVLIFIVPILCALSLVAYLCVEFCARVRRLA